MAAKIAMEAARAGLPESHHTVANAQGEGQSRGVRAQGHGVNAVAEGPRAQQRALVDVPDEKPAVVHAGEDDAAVAGKDHGLRTRIVESPQDAAVGRIANQDLAGIIAAGQPLPVTADGQRNDRRLMIGNRPHSIRLADVRAHEKVSAVSGGPRPVAGDDQAGGTVGQLVFDDQAGILRRHVPLQGHAA